jgi:hypothetical protein
MLATDLAKEARKAHESDPSDLGAYLTRIICLAYLLPSTGKDKGPLPEKFQNRKWR